MPGYPYHVEHVKPLTDHVLQVFLIPNSNKALHYKAGQYINIETSNGERRPFSIANAPLGSKTIELHIGHSPNDPYSEQLIQDLRHEKTVILHGPYGQCTAPENNEKPLILIAGGTGFAPMKALIEDILTCGNPPTITLFWGASTEAHLYLDTLPTHWASHIPSFHYVPVLSQPDDATAWQGEKGLVHEIVARTYTDVSGHLIYAAGPFEMVMAAYNALKLKGASRNTFFSDLFDI